MVALALSFLFAPIPLADAALTLDRQGFYDQYFHDFSGDGQADVARLAGRTLSLFFTPPNGYEAPVQPQVVIMLPSEVAVIAPAQFVKGSRSAVWIGLSRRGIWRLDKNVAGSSFTLDVATTLSLSSVFDAPHISSIATDLDNDGIDEVMAPVAGGLGVWKVQEGGGLKQAARMPWDDERAWAFDSGKAPNSMSPFSANPAFTRSPVYAAVWNRGPWRLLSAQQTGGELANFTLADLNGDGLPDLMGSEGTLLQKPGPQFAEPEKDLPFYDSLRWFRDVTIRHDPSSQVKSFAFFGDFEHNGKVDVLRIVGEQSLARPRTRLELFRSRFPEPFAQDADAKLMTSDYTPQPRSLPVVDFNNDGYLDILLTKLDLKAADAQSNLQAYFQKGLMVELRVYLWDPKGGPDGKGFFPDYPAFTHSLKLAYEIFGLLSEADIPVVVDRDFTGDGLPDLVTKTAADEVGLFPQLPGNKGFARQPLRSTRLLHKVQAVFARDVDGKPPVEILCVSPPDAEGFRQASVIHWDM